MAILVTGGAGYIGSHVVYALRDQNEKVVILDNLSTGLRAFVHPDVKFIRGDAGNQALVSRIARKYNIRAVMHFAASISVEEGERDPDKYFENNLEVTRRLLKVSAECGIPHFIFSSTAAVYGEPAEIPVPEEADLNPTSVYGTSKAQAEELVREKYPKSHVILRYFNVLGLDRFERTSYRIEKQPTHLVRHAFQVAFEGGVMGVFGTDYPTPDGTAIRDYVHVSDIAHAHVLALQYLRQGKPAVTLNVGYGNGLSVDEVLKAIEGYLGRTLPKESLPRRAGDISRIIADARRIRQVLGWTPQFASSEALLEHPLNWEQRTRSQLQ